VQDVVEYNSRTHHSNQDLYDRAQADDLKQASVLMAAFVYNTANRDEKLPRKPAAPKAATPPARNAAGGGGWPFLLPRRLGGRHEVDLIEAERVVFRARVLAGNRHREAVLALGQRQDAQRHQLGGSRFLVVEVVTLALNERLPIESEVHFAIVGRN